MEKVNFLGRWGTAAALLGGVVCLAAAGGLMLCSGPATAIGQSASMPPVSIQWQPQSTLEKLATAKIIEDAKLLKIELDKLAKKTDSPDDAYKKAWKEKFDKIHLRNPRYWVEKEWKTGWDEILGPMHGKIKGSAGISINAISGIIEYKERGNQEIDTEIDAVIKITVIFSASPDDNILEFELMHRRVCTWG